MVKRTNDDAWVFDPNSLLFFHASVDGVVVDPSGVTHAFRTWRVPTSETDYVCTRFVDCDEEGALPESFPPGWRDLTGSPFVRLGGVTCLGCLAFNHS